MIFCSQCGNENHEEAIFCVSCGEEIKRSANKVAPNQANISYKDSGKQPKRDSIKAFTSLLVGILSIVFIFLGQSLNLVLLTAIVGLVFGLIGMKEIEDHHLDGKGLSRAGIVLSTISLFISLSYLFLM